jgi:hypothetical protein
VLQSDERALEHARKQSAIEQTGDRAERLVLDDEPVDESVTVALEVALVARVG